MPDETRSASIMLKLLLFCCSLADTDLTAAKLRTLQQHFAVLTMLLGPLQNGDCDKM